MQLSLFSPKIEKISLLDPAFIVETITRYDSFTSDSDLEAHLLESILFELDNFTAYNNGRLRTPTSKWKVISALQKAIRLGLVDLAQTYATAMARFDDRYLFRRMAVIALEDCGFSTLNVTASLTSILGKHKWREENNKVKLAALFATALAQAPKNRSLCNLACLSWDSTLGGDYIELAKNDALKVDDLKDRVSIGIKSNCLSEKMEGQLSSVALCGGVHWTDQESKQRRYYKGDVKEYKRTISSDPTLPNILKYIVIKSLSFGLEGLNNGLPLLWNMYKQADPSNENVVAHEVYPYDMIGGIISSAYDKHVQEGKRSIAYFAKSCNDIETFFKKHPQVNVFDTLCLAVFEAEGGEGFDRSLVWDFGMVIKEAELVSDAGLCGLSLEDYHKLITLVTRNLNVLNDARRRIVDGKQ